MFVGACQMNCCLCPACGFANDEPPWNGKLPSFEICPCCLVQFGYDDACGGDQSLRPAFYAKWRAQWAAESYPWRGQSPKPASFDPIQQVAAVSS